MINQVDFMALIRDRLTENGFADVPEKEIVAFADVMISELKLAVGKRLMGRLTDGQIDEFEAICEQGHKRAQFLDRYAPDHQAIVVECRRELLKNMGLTQNRAPQAVSR